ncbi:hypothetical protein YDYSY3_45180 [Paenibacillus chitinolyticus]|uniref:hypothetical protein n=1 Tax=Paenibacillus chitinolyticus TaxID=79263 RepID=UPI0026E4F517|nr:hypothetical protein [Paenibacillus chitinolyticus]GKS13518.1 hypothetical protein YDYSY3_45180 [Paenibacillus chitinolyticus]
MKKNLLSLLAASLLTASLTPVVSAAEISKKPNVNELISPQATSGWSNQGGYDCRVYTDRSGSYPVSDDYIGVTAEKKQTGAAYYHITLWKQENGTENQKAEERGTFSTSANVKFKIDSFQDRNSQATYKVRFSLFQCGNWDGTLGQWTTDEFTVVN